MWTRPKLSGDYDLRTLDEYQEQYAFAPHSVELRSLVFQALAKERQDLERKYPNDRAYSSIDAVADVKRYADNCTLGRIREHWNGAVAKAVREGVTPVDTSTPPQRRQEARNGEGSYVPGGVRRYGVR